MSKSNVSVRRFNSTRFYFFAIFSLFASIAFAVQFTGVSSEASDKNLSETNVNQAKPAVSPEPTPEKPHTLVGSYYDTDTFPAAKLLLNNKDTVAREIRPTLYGLDGQVIEMPPVQVEAESFRLINLKEWADFAGNGFGKGSVKLFHTGKDLVIGSQIYLEDEAQSLSFEEKLSEIGNFDSRRLEGVWFQPSNQTESKIVISNVSEELLTVTVTPSRRPHIVGSPQAFTLQPHQARVIDMRETFGNAFGNSEAVGVSITHNGTASALLARAMVSEASKGYSTVVTFRNPDTAKSSQLHGAGVKLGAIDGDLLNPVLIVRNTGAADTGIKVNIPYTHADGTNKVIYLDEINLRGNEIKQINLNAITDIAGQGGVVKTAGIEVKNQTANGGFVAQMQSVSRSRRQSFRVILWDAAAQKSATGGYPWLINGNSSTKAYIKNVTYYSHHYVSYITWSNGGMYMIGIKKLAPHQTAEIDVKKLRDEQIPDEEGRTIPLDVSTGQIQWTRKIQGTNAYEDTNEIPLVGQMEQTDEVKGISSSYFCQNCCYDSSFGYVLPANRQVEFDTEILQYESYEEGESCYNGRYIYRTTSLAAWSSSNTAVASSQGQGKFKKEGVGTTNVKAKFNVTFHYLYGPCGGGGPYLTNYDENDVLDIKENPKKLEKEADEQNRPDDCDCICTSPEVSPDTPLKIIPKVTLTPILAVGRDYTADIQMEMLPANGQTPVTLTLTTSSGSGEARFDSNNSTTLTLSPTQQFTLIKLKGVTESSTTDNIKLDVKYNNAVVATDNLTVLLVTLSLRFGNNDTVSLDNSSIVSQQTIVGTTQLGGPFYSTGTGDILWRHAIEIIGTITPNNFASPIVLQRELLILRSWNENNGLATNAGCGPPPQPTPCADTSFPQFLDTLPLSGGSPGRVFDIDSPGLNLIPLTPVGAIRRRRINFRQWATISQMQGNTTVDVRISPDILWYQRLAIEKVRGGNVVINNAVAGDNQVGQGTTPITWDLQP